jgi:hypothetical protein
MRTRENFMSRYLFDKDPKSVKGGMSATQLKVRKGGDIAEKNMNITVF